MVTTRDRSKDAQWNHQVPIRYQLNMLDISERVNHEKVPDSERDSRPVYQTRVRTTNQALCPDAYFCITVKRVPTTPNQITTSTGGAPQSVTRSDRPAAKTDYGLAHVACSVYTL
ncbi:hypothetical protein AVEN_91482-1 [Araneus ventricosus]|uniref:Uncharacterized protein n=1 Tax=Araneus ventricosus TaxID=182803 RepID=A0A4Y2BIR3_ARAVE|nr:hypothetical protein AVEN_91482-1 [Araneus ventricosus]